MNSSSSITYRHKLSSSYDLSGGILKTSKEKSGVKTPNTSNVSFDLAKLGVETSTPKTRLNLSRPTGKENKPCKNQEQKPKKTTSAKATTTKKPLKSLETKTQSQAIKKSPAAPKAPTRRTTAFEVLRSGDETDCEKTPKRRSEGARKIPVRVNIDRRSMIESASPEYNEPVSEQSMHIESGKVAGADGKSAEPSTIEDKDYRELDQTLKLMHIFPDIDPGYLRAECQRVNAPLEEVIRSIVHKISKSKIPLKTREQDLKRRSEPENPLVKYLDTFSLDQILKILPDPWSYFGGNDRGCEKYTDNSCYYLKCKFRKHFTQTINDALAFHNHNLYMTYKYLSRKNRGLKLRATNRPLSSLTVTKPRIFNRIFLLEMTFIERESALTNYMDHLKLIRTYTLKTPGMAVTCNSCYSTNFLEEDVFTCKTGRKYCKKCIASFFGICLREGKRLFMCLGKCGEDVPMEVLEKLLRPDLFSKVVDMYLNHEGSCIPNLARCPFCWFVAILPQDVQLVTCLNPRCLSLTCRKCKRLSHAPFACRKIGTENEQKVESQPVKGGAAAEGGDVRAGSTDGGAQSEVNKAAEDVQTA